MSRRQGPSQYMPGPESGATRARPWLGLLSRMDEEQRQAASIVGPIQPIRVMPTRSTHGLISALRPPRYSDSDYTRSITWPC